MLSNELSIERFKNDDFDHLKSVFKEVYPSNPLMQSRSYFDWQFKDTPVKDAHDYHFWILRQADCIKGFLGYLPLEFRYGQEVFQGCWSLNWAALAEGHAD